VHDSAAAKPRDEELYLDHNATTPPAPEVVAAMMECLAAGWGNPSSTHAPGRAARERLEVARARVAHLVDAEDPREVLFTSGGTESIQAAILGAWRARRTAHRDTIIASTVEHAATRAALEAARREGARIVLAPVDDQARLASEDVLRRVDGRTALVSLLLANNEVGTLLDLGDLGTRCRAAGALLHLDAVQAVGRVPLSVRALQADLVSLSAHKLHGPKGVGALWVRRGTAWQAATEGSQEAGRRGGTENLPGIVGFGVAAKLARDWLQADGWRRLAALRDEFETRLAALVPDVVVHARAAPRLPNTSSVRLPGLDAELLLGFLDAHGVHLSAGSACHATARAPSPVLAAMHLGDQATRETVRVSFGRMQDQPAARRAAEWLAQAAQELGRPVGHLATPDS
jgi:cysteine desulfurase